MSRGRSALDFVATKRFEIVRHIGSGGMGSVYEAFDCELDARVALKRLDGCEPRQLLRFKREFRDFQDLSHPNLVTLRELFSDGAEWFFSMELLDGVDFLEYVRPSIEADRTGSSDDSVTITVTRPGRTMAEGARPRARTQTRTTRGPLDEQRLRRALPQLALGIHALHEAGKLHCDIKPSNVLVTRDDRVVLVDYGVAVDLHEAPRARRVTGTVAYMAPEQAACRTTGRAADWYAVGVVLYEALTGRRPHQGTEQEILDAKHRIDGPSPRDIEPFAPRDLSALCEDLMRADPAARPSGAEVLARLGTKANLGRLGRVSPRARSRSTGFVGRSAQLAALDAAYRRSRERAQLVLVYGESGLGKSALVRHFIDELGRSDPRAVALTGACCERESVPYKAFDGVIDALCHHVEGLPAADAKRLIPEHIALVAHAFPVLWGSRAVWGVTSSIPPRLMDPQEQRHRLFGTLRELFRRLGDAAPLVVAIDDLQWADADSRALLSELLAEPGAPRLLLVATMRTDDANAEPLASEELGGLVRDAILVPVERLLPHEACALAERLVRDNASSRELDPSVLARVAEGHPLFLDALVRHASVVDDASPLTSLDQALWARIAPLPSDARRVLELVAIANGSIAQDTVGVAAKLPVAELADHVAALRASHLLATSGSGPRDQVAPYHDQIRRAVLAHVDASAQRDHHRRLAEALEATNYIDPEALTVHWRESGERARAATFAKLAAEKATSALAFDRAAAFYEQCLALLGPSAPREIVVRHAEALANAGRGGEAGAQYLFAAGGGIPGESIEPRRPAAEPLDPSEPHPPAAEQQSNLAPPLSRGPRSTEQTSADSHEAHELRRRAAEQMLRSGHVDEGIAVLRDVLASVGLKLAPSPARALSSLLGRRAQISLRGLKYGEREESRVAPEVLTKIDTCWAAAACLSVVDTIRGADFQAQHLLLALKAGEPYRIARAMALEGGYQSLAGGAGAQRAASILERASDLAKRIGNPHAIGLSSLMMGIAAFQAGEWRTACERLTAAESTLRESCTGVAWELTSGQVFHLNAIYYVGRLAELQLRVPSLIKEAQSRGDLYATTDLRLSNMNSVWLAQDDVASARQASREAMAQWSPRGYLDQHFYALMAETNIDLYAGDGAAAYRRITEQWPAVKKAMLLRIQSIRVVALQMRAYAAVASAESAQSGLLEAAERDAVALKRERMEWATAFAAAIQAATAVARGRAEEAVELLASAQQHFLNAEMPLFAAASARHRGVILGGDEGSGLVRRSDAAMGAQRIRHAERFANMLIPGFRQDDQRRTSRSRRDARGRANGQPHRVHQVSEMLELRRRAAEQLLISGRIDLGLSTLREVLTTAGMNLAETPRRALVNLLWSRAQIRLRGLGFTERDPSTIPAEELMRIDICWSTGLALALVDSVRGADFQARNLLLSLRAGEPYRVARALAMEAGYLAIHGSKTAARTAQLQREAATIADRVGHPHPIGLVKLTAGIAAFLNGTWQATCDLCGEAEVIFRDRCTGVTWELDNARLYPLWARIFLGQLGALGPRASLLLEEARARGDLYLETNLRTRVMNMALLAADQPASARREVEEAIAGWSQAGFHLQNYFALHSRVEIALYEGQGAAAHQLIEDAWPLVRGSDFELVQLMRIETLALRARCALMAAAEDNARAPALWSAARGFASQLLKEKSSCATAFAQLINATADGRGQVTDANRSMLVSARDAFEQSGMALHAAAIRARLGHAARAAELMASLGIHNCERMTNLFAPGLQSTTDSDTTQRAS